MKCLKNYLPALLTLLVLAAGIFHGPVAQLPNYHDFADQQTIYGIPHFADVASNLAFIVAALWGLSRLPIHKDHPNLADGWAGYRLFLLGLLLTGFGSSFYHLAPDNMRLIWDRLPIALACAGLLAGVWGDVKRRDSSEFAGWLGVVALLSVAWWYYTESIGLGDLRPYLFLQVLPILLIPVWQASHDVPRTERVYFGSALLLYVIAKLAEISDHAIAHLSGVVSGHTLKHLIAAAAAALIVAALVRRVSRGDAEVCR